MEIPRCYFTDSIDTNFTTELHVFTYSSLVAYGACVYIIKGEQASLMKSSNRVAPIKEITLPKMELMGSRLAKHLQKTLGIMDVIFWCDSQIVLKWITSPKPQKKFISNQVKEIKENVHNRQWRYCPTDSNPADLLTREISADKVKNTFWMNGPQWLTIKSESEWPQWNGNTECALETRRRT